MGEVNLLNFTIGPVMTWDEILSVSANQVPYFRTPEFSKIMLDNEQMMIDYSGAPENSRCVFLTGSGSMGMEAAVTNFLSEKDRVIIINGGSFGHRFVELCEHHSISYKDIKLSLGEALTADNLEGLDVSNYSALLINMHETSTGVLYDMKLVADYCKRHGLFLIVDAISSFMADWIDMTELGIDVMITSSQKAFACAPGITMITMSPRAISRLNETSCCNVYMDLKLALSNGDRGQTPFTPAVLTLLQINKRLHMVDSRGGMAGECKRVGDIAEYFRKKIVDLPLVNVSHSLSNAVTALHPTNEQSSKELCDKLKDEYGIWVCPNGGSLADYMFRVGHIGNITFGDIDRLVEGLKECLN